MSCAACLLTSPLHVHGSVVTWLQRPPPRGGSVRDEAPGTSHPDLLSLLSRYARAGTVRHVYSGHYHRGVNWDSDMYPFPFTTLPAVRYDEDNFFVMELDWAGKTHR